MEEKIQKGKPVFQKLAVMDRALDLSTGTNRGELVDYEGRRSGTGEILKEFYRILERMGFKSDPEFMEILEGNSELFEEEKDERA